MNILNEYYSRVDDSNLNGSHLINDFRVIWKEIHEINESNDTSEEELLKLQWERDILDISKSMSRGLQPKMKWNGTDENGNVIELYTPDFRKYGDAEKEYFKSRYESTSNYYLKSEYGLYLLLSKELVRNDDKAVLCSTLENLVEEYFKSSEADKEKWSHYLFPAFERWSDAFIILSRAGAPLQEQFSYLVRKIESKLLDCDIDDESFYHLASFAVSLFLNNSKKVVDLINARKVLSKLESYVNKASNDDTRGIINISELILAFCKIFNVSTDTSYHRLLGETHENIGDVEVENERWAGAVKSYEDALIHYKLGNETDCYHRCKSKINEHKGKFKMGTIAHEADEEMVQRINDHINELIEEGDIIRLFLAISGVGVYPKAEFLYSQAEESASTKSLTNLGTQQSLDKYGNVSRIYRTKEEKEVFHLFMSMNLASQMGVNIIGQTFIRALKEKKIKIEHIVGMFMSSWLNEEVSWNRSGETVSIKPIDAVLPGVLDFYNQVLHAIEDENYEPSYVCCIDSMTLKIEYILRNMCRKLDIPTFKYVGYDKEAMTAEEKPLTGLLFDLKEFLREDDILLIRYLFNEKGGYNIRNQIAHGLVDGKEYGLDKALFAFSVLIRLTGYTFESCENTD